jgi:hypothetical protein
MVPVQPHCVKPWIVPNQDPRNPAPGATFIDLSTGRISNPGIRPHGGTGVIGEPPLTLVADCNPGTSNATSCIPVNNPPQYPSSPPLPATDLEYVPALISGAPSAVPSCSTTAGYTGTGYQAAIAGCDQNTVYACGIPTGSPGGTTQVNPSENPIYPTALNGDTSTATQCLINQANGADTLAGGSPPSFPFQIQAGAGSPLLNATPPVSSGDIVTTSNSIVTIPIADFSGGGQLTVASPGVTIVGFLQVFINSVDASGNVNVTVLNVSGCGNNAPTTRTLYGTSPVPVRLITPPS